MSDYYGKSRLHLEHPPGQRVLKTTAQGFAQTPAVPPLEAEFSPALLLPHLHLSDGVLKSDGPHSPGGSRR